MAPARTTRDDDAVSNHDTPETLLAAYDAQLRTDAEMVGAERVERIGPLLVGTFPGGRGHVTYPHPTPALAPRIAEWVGEALALLTSDPGVVEAEVKTRGHDGLGGLDAVLEDLGCVAGDAESVMVGRADLLAVEVDLPDGVTLRQVHTPADVQAMVRLADEVFGRSSVGDEVKELLDRLASGDGTSLWVAEVDGQLVSTGRLEPVPGTEFAGLWGGCTHESWRGRGIYRALTAARARAAIDRGVRWLHSDSTECSRPILERSGFHRVTTTVPWVWRRPA